MLIDKGADVRAVDNLRRTPLHIAAKHNNVDVVNMLLKYGRDVNGRDDNQSTPLPLAAMENPSGMRKLIREAVVEKWVRIPPQI